MAKPPVINENDLLNQKHASTLRRMVDKIFNSYNRGAKLAKRGIMVNPLATENHHIRATENTILPEGNAPGNLDADTIRNQVQILARTSLNAGENAFRDPDLNLSTADVISAPENSWVDRTKLGVDTNTWQRITQTVVDTAVDLKDSLKGENLKAGAKAAGAKDWLTTGALGAGGVGLAASAVNDARSGRRGFAIVKGVAAAVLTAAAVKTLARDAVTFGANQLTFAKNNQIRR